MPNGSACGLAMLPTWRQTKSDNSAEPTRTVTSSLRHWRRVAKRRTRWPPKQGMRCTRQTGESKTAKGNKQNPRHVCAYRPAGFDRTYSAPGTLLRRLEHEEAQPHGGRRVRSHRVSKHRSQAALAHSCAAWSFDNAEIIRGKLVARAARRSQSASIHRLVTTRNPFAKNSPNSSETTIE